MILDLKQGDLNLEESIKREIDFYDEYYSIQNRIVKGFKQEFLKDPYMVLEPMPQIRLIAYDPNLDNQSLEEVFNLEDLPIITRTSTQLNGFREIRNQSNDSSFLLPIQIDLSSVNFEAPTLGLIDQMKKEDLPSIQELFRRQYSLRYRMVDLMFQDSPDTCFIFRVNNQILGVSFNQIRNNELYMRQLFVDENYRGQGIGEKLYLHRLNLAKQKGLKSASAHIRKEAIMMHSKFKAYQSQEEKERYIIRL